MKNGTRSRRSARVKDATSESAPLTPLIHVWLAGLGAVSRARTGGPKLLDELIKEGARVQGNNRKIAKNAIHSRLGDMQKLVKRVVDGLPPVQILHELRALRRQVDTMNAGIDTLLRSRGASRKRASTKRET